MKTITSHRTMERILLLSSLLICISTSFAYDLNHIQDGVLLRQRRQADDVVQRFLQNLENPKTGLIVLIDRSKHVTSKAFHTEVMELVSNVLRYHVLDNKVVLLTFSGLVSEIHNGFKDTNNQKKCKFFESKDAIWSKLKYKIADESQNADPDFRKAFVRAEELGFTHTGNGGVIVILVITAGDEGADTDSNRWLIKAPTNWLKTTKVFVATTSTSRNTDAITSASNQNNASITTWISGLKKYQGNNPDLNLEDSTYGEACPENSPENFCNPYTGSSFCTSCSTDTKLQPLTLTPTPQAAIERLMLSECSVEQCDSSSCKQGTCLSPYGVSVCYCNQGFTGTNCEESLCKACEKTAKEAESCNGLCMYQPKRLSSDTKSVPPFALIIPCAVGGFIILLVTILLICVCCRQKGGGGGGGGGGGITKKKKTPPPPPDPSLKPVGLVAPTSRPARIRDTTPEEDNLYAHYGKIPRHQNMPEWLGYIEEMVTIGHMEAAAIIKYDMSEWVCSERAFKVNQKEYDVLNRLLDKRMPNYKVKFKRKEYFLTENDGETLVMESFNPRGEMMVVLARTRDFLVAVKVTNVVGAESAKSEVEWVKDAIGQQEY